MDNNPILNRIDELREERHWSVNELTSRTGLAAGTIYAWYNQGKKPTLSAIEEVCKAFGISISEFFAFSAKDRCRIASAELAALCEGMDAERIEALITIARTLKRNE